MKGRGNNVCLATYNIWNSDVGMPYRNECIIQELQKINADILCLQEVTNSTLAKEIADRLGMDHYFAGYKNEEEGICVLGRYPMIEKEDWIDINAQYVEFQLGSANIGIVNCHLPWDSVLRREKCICDIVTRLDDKKRDYIYVLGDFNSGDHADVFRFLKGECVLHEKECNPCFYDLGAVAAQVKGTSVKDTLDFRGNPVFRDNTIEINQRTDRIFLRNTYPMDLPRLVECDVFGTKIYPEINLPASDHYGVYAVSNF